MSTAVTASCTDCGWTSVPCRTPAQADYAHRKHSCDRQLFILARAERVAQRKAASGPIRDCPHDRKHQHGERNAYVIDRCRCRPCRDAASQYERWRARQSAYGRDLLVNATPVREHILALGAQGMGWKRVAAAAGLEPSVLWKIVYGDQKRFGRPSSRVTPATRDKVMAVTLDLADGATIDGTGTRRRLQALSVIGWSQPRLARLLGVAPANFNSMIHGRRSPGVTVATARAAAALYDQLWNVTPDAANRFEAAGITHTRRAAENNGWAPPLAWDDDTIDDPTAEPYVGDAEPKTARGRLAEQVAEDVEFILDLEPMATAQRIADRLGNLGRDAVQKACRTAGRDDLVALLARNALLAKEYVA